MAVSAASGTFRQGPCYPGSLRFMRKQCHELSRGNSRERGWRYREGSGGLTSRPYRSNPSVPVSCRQAREAFFHSMPPMVPVTRKPSSDGFSPRAAWNESCAIGRFPACEFVNCFG